MINVPFKLLSIIKNFKYQNLDIQKKIYSEGFKCHWICYFIEFKSDLMQH